MDFYSIYVSSLSSFLFGLSLTNIECIRKLVKSNEIDISEFKWSIIVSVISISALIANILLYNMRSYKSLKHRIIGNNIFYLIGTIMLLFPSFVVLVLARFIIGIGIGVTCTTIPLYLNLISSKENRGVVCSCNQVGIVSGVLAGQLITFLIPLWRVCIYSCVIFIIIHTILLFYIENIQISQNTGNFMSLIRNKSAQKSLCLSVIIHFSQQFSCFNNVLNYSSTLFDETSSPQLYSVLIGIASLISTLVSMAFVDRYGRKMLLAMSYMTCIFTLIILSYKLTIYVLFLYIAGFNFGLGPVTWFITGEIFPENDKEAGTMIGVSANWFSYFLVSVSFPMMLKYFKGGSFAVFAVILGMFFIYFLCAYTETKGKETNFQ